MKTIAWGLFYRAWPEQKLESMWLTHDRKLDHDILKAKLFDVPEAALEADEEMDWVPFLQPGEAVPILVQPLKAEEFHMNPS